MDTARRDSSFRRLRSCTTSLPSIVGLEIALFAPSDVSVVSLCRRFPSQCHIRDMADAVLRWGGVRHAREPSELWINHAHVLHREAAQKGHTKTIRIRMCVPAYRHRV